jgi:hypothetical protein
MAITLNGTTGITTADIAATTLTVNAGYGSNATAYLCRAWVNFNGTSTVAIRASGNVSSITDNGTGNYTINFTTAMPDANYSINLSRGTPVGFLQVDVGGVSSPSTTTLRIDCVNAANNAYQDVAEIHASIFR